MPVRKVKMGGQLIETQIVAATPQSEWQNDPLIGANFFMADDCTTIQAAKLLGLAVRSIQLMVDRGELEAWKTQGGHRRISRKSLERWLSKRTTGKTLNPMSGPGAAPDAVAEPMVRKPETGSGTEPVAFGNATRKKILLIEDSRHYQRLITHLINDHFPEVDVRVADDGIVGMVLYGELQPDILIVDILLPGIDGGILISTLRTHEKFSQTALVVVTGLNPEERRPYNSAIGKIPVIDKANVAHELPKMLVDMLTREVIATRVEVPAARVTGTRPRRRKAAV